MKKPSNYNQILKALTALHTTYPKYSMGKHLSTALDGYDIWFISDKEMLFAIEKYSAEMQYDIPHEDKEIDAILKDGMNLSSISTDDYYNDREDE